MNLAILQLSDIHISSQDEPILGKAHLIRSAIQPRIPDDCALLMAYTGDIAFSGQKQEYDIAQQFLDELTTEVKQIPGLHILGTVIVPGNHDCDFSLSGDARPVMLSSVAANLKSVDLNGESIDQLLKVQRNFFEFEYRHSGENRMEPASRTFWTTSYNYAGKQILIRCLNTALFSRLKELPAQLYFPLHAVPERNDGADFIATILHHPYGWLAPDNSRDLRRLIESTSDIVLTGHEHDGDAYTRIGRGGDETNYVEGAALQADGRTGINLILVNLAENTNQIFAYRWDNDIYQPDSTEAHVFTRKKPLLEGRFDNNSEFSKYLNSLGAGFSHPDKELTLRDLFVYPELKVVSVSAKGHVNIHSWSVLSFVATEEYLQIAGAPTSGKSTLARALYLDLQHEYDLVPILLDAQSLRGSGKDDLDRAVRRGFTDQYRETSFERFLQLDQSRKVLLIDDWHRLRLPSKAKKRVLEVARAAFGKVIVFSDDISLFQLLADTADDGAGSEAEYCEIKQFGYRLRSEVIRKWHSVGTELGVDDMELTSRISTSENLLDTLVRKGTVPSWPIFILSVLQASSLAVEETALYGSYGHLYEALLTRRMADTSKRRQTLGLKYTYLSLVAYQLFKTGRLSLSEGTLRAIHSRYEIEYQVSLNEKELWDELAAAQVLVRTGDEFHFQYKYAYYFFVAKYFQQGMVDIKGASELRAQLSYMVRCVHDEEYANILIFYIYMTKDRDLIDQMLGVASRIYAEKEPAHFTSDVEFVNRLRSKSPDILLERTTIDENRNERRSQMDASQHDEQTDEEVVAKTEYADNISDVLKIEFAFKSLQVMGQVVKNFPLDLKGDLKVALTKQSYELTLRTLRTYLEVIESNMAELLHLLDRALRGLQPFTKKSNEEIRDASQVTMVRLTEFAIFGMIKKLSLAVGVTDLKETYDQVRQIVGEDDMAARLIDLSIKLDHFGHIPEEDVRELEQRLRKNLTAYTILKWLVAEFLNLFPCSYKTEQKMVQLFKFQHHVPKLAEKKVKKLKD